MNIVSYKTAYEVPFGASLNDVKALYGEPQHTRIKPKNSSCQIWYSGFSFNFADDKMVEFNTDLKTEINVNGMKLNKNIVLTKIKEMDPECIEFAGTIISYKLGLSLDVEHVCITAFIKGRMDKFKDKGR